MNTSEGPAIGYLFRGDQPCRMLTAESRPQSSLMKWIAGKSRGDAALSSGV
jgi:hypothetical protein